MVLVTPPNDLKKFRAKHLVHKIESTRRYEVVPPGLRRMSALIVLRDQVIKPLLAVTCQLKRGPKPKSCTTLDRHDQTLRTEYAGPIHGTQYRGLTISTIFCPCFGVSV